MVDKDEIFTILELYNINGVKTSRWEVDVTNIRDWLVSLDQTSFTDVIAALEVLRDEGPQLGRPLVDTVKGSTFKNMKELRPGSRGSTELRVLFAFDPRRIAVMLVAGDKRGSWAAWYRNHVPKADRIFDDHLTRLAQEKQT